MKELLLHLRPEQTVLALLSDGRLEDLSVERAGEENIVGRVYKGIIRNVVPSLNGLFVDIGIGRNAFLRTKDVVSKNRPIRKALRCWCRWRKTPPSPRAPW